MNAYTVLITYRMYGVSFANKIDAVAFSAADACRLVEDCARRMFAGISAITTEVVPV